MIYQRTSREKSQDNPDWKDTQKTMFYSLDEFVNGEEEQSQLSSLINVTIFKNYDLTHLQLYKIVTKHAYLNATSLLYKEITNSSFTS